MDSSEPDLDRFQVRWRLGEALNAPSSADAEREAYFFRDVLGHFASGVAVVTALHEGQPVGMTCQSFTSVSLSPPLVLFCPSRTSRAWPLIRESGHFCANILAADQSGLSDAMATKGAHKFDGVAWSPAKSGAPLLDGTLGWVDCAIQAVHEAGDHDVVVGRVIDLGLTPPAPGEESTGDPLLFFRGGYRA